MGFPRSDVEIVYAVNEANMKHPGRRKWGRLQLRCEAEEVDKGGRRLPAEGSGKGQQLGRCSNTLTSPTHS